LKNKKNLHRLYVTLKHEKKNGKNERSE